jgi:5'(3')-deoxyribonucleotidase
MGIRNYLDIPRIYLDMDGVIVDFERECERLGLPPKQLKLVPGIYRDMKPIEGAIFAINSLLDIGEHKDLFEIFFLTKIPSENPYSAAEKLLWVNKYLPRVGERVIITPDKGCVGTSRDILVDDHPEWANAHNFPGKIIHFGNHTKDWDETIALILSHFQSCNQTL